MTGPRRSLLVTAVLAAAAALVLLAGVRWLLWFREAAFVDRRLPAAPVTVVVPRGSTFAEVRAHLAAAGVLAQPVAFRLLASLRHDEARIQSGEYRFPAHQTTDEILRRLVEGRADALWVTFPEGFTARQIGRRLAQRNVLDAAAFDRYAHVTGLMIDGHRTPSLEGYLFPDTYLIPVDSTPARVAKILTDQFFRELPANAGKRAAALGYTIPEIVTVASLIEREAKADDERALMAGVYYNRLREGMPLDVDATIEYVFPVHHDVITLRDLKIDSPYNTYLHTGLPPTPIANPGKASIDAAFAPAHTAYLYYVYKGNGHHAFATTLQQHEANVRRYLH